MIRLTIVALLWLCQGALAQDKIGIIYGEESGQIRRIVAPASGNFTVTYHGKGEAILVVDAKGLNTIDAIKAFLQKATGKDPEPKPAAILASDGTIEAVIKADPAIDAPPAGKRLMSVSDDAAPGDKVVGSILEKRQLPIQPDPPDKAAVEALRAVENGK